MMPLRNRLLVGDAVAGMRQLPPASVDMVLTSPPYFRLRHYDAPVPPSAPPTPSRGPALGLELSVDDWVTALLPVTRHARRVLTPTGTLWLNLGDSYAAAPEQGASRKSLLLGPERLALRLIEDGWSLRNKIVWQKANPMPTSVRDRLACTWEYLFVFARQPDYFFDLDALRRPHRTAATPSRRRPAPADTEAWRGPNAASRGGLNALKAAGRPGHPLGKNPGDVWTIATSNYRSPHRAPFPLELARRAIQAGCPEAACVRCRRPWRRRVIQSLGAVAVQSTLGPTCDCAVSGHRPGLVLDPFIGSGTTAVAAEGLKRDWLGIELSPTYARTAEQRIWDARAGPAAA